MTRKQFEEAVENLTEILIRSLRSDPTEEHRRASIAAYHNMLFDLIDEYEKGEEKGE